MSLSRFFRRAKQHQERTQELDAYLRIEIDENIARGMPDSEARAAALRKLGNRTRIREEIYNMNTISILDTLGRDLRYAVRALRRNPTFTAVALLTLALGIGANTAVFSVVNSVLLKPLNYPESEQLVGVWHAAPGAPGMSSVSGDLRLSPSMYFTYSEQNQTFQSFGVWAEEMSAVTGLAEPERVRSARVSDGLLQTLAVPPATGRWLARDDQIPGGRATAMLGYGYWQRRFGGDRSVIGRAITVDANSVEVIGVMPQGFRILDYDPELILPPRLDRGRATLPGFAFQGIARLKPGITVSQANADVARLLPIWQRSWPMAPGGRVLPTNFYLDTWRLAPAVRPLKNDVVGDIGNTLWIVMATIGLVMLIACANVANLLLVRADGRQQELAIRAALGAGWTRIVKELLIESLVLGMIGGTLGTGLAYAGLSALVSFGPANLPRLSEISIDTRALLFTLAISILSALLFGLIPALKYAGPRISAGMRSAGRTASLSRERHRARNILVVAQVSMALVLLISAGLMIRTLAALRTVDPGFTHAQQLQTMRIAIPQALVSEPDRVLRMQRDILDKLKAIPGVTEAAFAVSMPMEGIPANWDTVGFEDKPDPPGDAPVRLFQFVSPDLFRAMGTKLIAGRGYTWNDLDSRRSVVMISENLAREVWGSPSAALGKRMRSAPGVPGREVIGVVQDVRYNGLQEEAPATVFWPSIVDSLYPGAPRIVFRDATFVVRTSRAGTASLLEEIRRAVWSVNSSLPVTSMPTMQELSDRSLARTSFTLVMLGIAGTMALLLGIVGIYGVLSYAVSQRRREIGIRVALGAQQNELKRMFVRDGLILTGIGIAIGLAASAALMRLMKAILFGTSPLDPPTYAAVPLVLLAAAVLASYLPASRAAKVDPVEALKAE